MRSHLTPTPIVILLLLVISRPLAAAETYDADAQAFFDQVAISGGTISGHTMAAVNDFVLGLKADGIWPKLIRINLFCGDQLAAALTPLRATAGTAIEGNANFTDADYSEAVGLIGDGATKSLDTGVSPSSLGSTSDDHLMVYETQRSTIDNTFSISCSSASNLDPWGLRIESKAEQGIEYLDDHIHAGTYDAGNPIRYPNGMFIGSTSSGIRSLYVDGSLQGSMPAPIRAATSNTVQVFRDTYGLNSNATLGAYSLGNALSAADAAHYWLRLRTFMRAIHRSFPDPITCWGDSLTAGVGGTPYVTDLHAYYPERAMFNRGIGGQTSSQILARALAETARQEDFCVWWAGRNNVNDANFIQEVLGDTATYLAFLGHQRFLVLSVLNGEYTNEFIGQSTYENLVTLNAALLSRYAANYIDARSALVAAYNPALAQDVLDHGHDTTPTSLRFDSIHLNSSGYALVTTLLAGRATNALTITIDDVTTTYGAGPVSYVPDYIGLIDGDGPAALSGSLIVTAPGPSAPVGTYPISASGLSSTKYVIAYVPGTLTITPAPLTITANNLSIMHGNDIPTLTASYQGFVNGDSIASLTAPATLSTTANRSSPSGTYPILVMGAIDPNYIITYVSGVLKILSVITTSGNGTSTATGNTSGAEIGGQGEKRGCGLGGISTIGLASLVLLLLKNSHLNTRFKKFYHMEY